jgi:hypothetical protein
MPRRLQFSLKSLFVVVTLASLVAATTLAASEALRWIEENSTILRQIRD